MTLRRFTSDDQQQFAALSGDFNPLHVDALAARRLLFGRPVVHGIHALLWVIDAYLDGHAANARPLRIQSLRVDFRSPLIVDEPIELSVRESGRNTGQFELTAGKTRLASGEFAFADGHQSETGDVPDRSPERAACREPALSEVGSAKGSLSLFLDRGAGSRLFPHACRLLPAAQVAGLLASTRLVGMQMPGLHSLYTGLDLAASDEARGAALTYQVVGYDARFPMLVNMQVEWPGLKGRIATAFRPRPTDQPGMADIRKLVTSGEFAGERALVIGGSRGLGALAVKQLAAGGAEVRFTYHRGMEDAQRIVDEVLSAGGAASSFAYDVLADGGKLPALLGGWSPTMLCYFATPFIATGTNGVFSSELFRKFCGYYVDGFLEAFRGVEAGSGLVSVLNPSSIFVEETPPNMGEYAAAKAAAESLCAFLAQAHKKIRFHYPRLSKLATDQTASLIGSDAGDPQPVLLDVLRRMRRGEAMAALPVKRATADAGPIAPATQGPPFAVAATFTAEPIEPTLRFWASQWGGGAVEFAPYNQVFQAMLDRAGLFTRQNFANTVLIRHEDWVEGDKSTLDADEWTRRLEPLVDEFLAAVRAATRPSPTIVVVCPPSLPLAENPLTAAALDALATRLLSGLAGVPGVFAFGSDSVSALYPVKDYYDAGADAIGKIPYTAAYFAALGTFVARKAHALRRPPFKVIVLDCDNTLWAGVCGEGGLAAVTVDAGYRAMQEFLAAQAAAGKVLCLASKNVEADVFEILDKHDGMVLRRTGFAASRINWSPKSGNLRELARELNLGLDSFVFLDDNPIECAEVQANRPEVLTLQAPPPERSAEWPDFLRHVWAFDQLVVTEQDRQRAASYLQNARREAARKESAGLDDFLSKLQLEVTIAPPTPQQMARVAQLAERTNQFNVSTIRRTEPEVLKLLEDPRYTCDAVSVKDRFGDYGLVGVVITRKEETSLTVDTLLLSCRVLGRGVEHRMIATLGARAAEMGKPHVVVPFVRSKKNQPAEGFLDTIAADHRHNTVDGAEYRLPTAVAIAAPELATAQAAPQDEREAKSATSEDGASRVRDIPYQRIATELRGVDQILAAVRAQSAAPSEAGPADFVEPQNERQRKLAEIWCAVLNLPRVGIHDSYFDLGGTSLLAVRLVLEIEKVFGRQFPIAVLMKAPTIAQLSEQLGEPAAGDDLGVATLISEGSNPPLFLLPGIGGNTMTYRLVASKLGTNQPVYGMEMRANVEANRRPRPMETIAAETLERIIKVEPNGPYFLAGYSFGGALAFEIARQLQRRGKRVAMCALFDTFCEGRYPRVLAGGERLRAHVARFKNRSVGENLSYLGRAGGVLAQTVQHKVLRLTGVRKTDFYSYPTAEIEQVVQVCSDAWKAYRPSPIAGKVVLVRARHRPERIGVSYDDPFNGWGELVPDGITVHTVDGDHLNMFEGESAGQVAAALARSIREALG